MKIQNSYNLNFGAKFVQKTAISKLENGNTSEEAASIVELLSNDKNDIKSFEKTVKGWQKGDEFGLCIFDDLEDIRDKKMSKDVYKVYALTTQSDNFEKLDSSKILGASTLKLVNEKENHIRFLQVSPKCYFENKQRGYKSIGKAFIDFFKSQSKNKSLLVQAYFSAANFYEKMGFEIIDVNNLIYSWSKLIKK